MVIEVKALACELPSRLGLPLSRLFVPDIRDEVVSRGVVAEISGSTIWRWLTEDAIRPWTYRSWVFPRDPDFERKAGRVLDLYARTFEGKRLRPNDYVISADEKTSIQARCRCHPTLPASTSRAMRIEHEYERAGALQYLVAYDVHRARLFGRCEDKTGIVPFGRLVDEVMGQEPYASARRVFWVVDNGSSHRGQASVDRLQGRHKNLRLIHCPIHSSWINQVSVNRPSDRGSAPSLEIHLAAVGVRNNEAALGLLARKREGLPWECRSCVPRMATGCREPARTSRLPTASLITSQHERSQPPPFAPTPTTC